MSDQNVVVDVENTVMSMTVELDNTKLSPKVTQKIKKASLASLKSQKTHFIGIHLGAGTHSPKMSDTYKALCKQACNEGVRILKKGGTAIEAVTAATVILENSPHVNAGRGSNLTMAGTVECDAGFMSGDGHFGGVGAVGGVPNPILLAKRIAELQDPDYELSCGRVPPVFLVGDGAKKWAVDQDIPTCEASMLISKKALKRHTKYTERINKLPKDKTETVVNGGVSDTVGVIALDHSNKVAASVSSGGNWLKVPGRVGHCPQFGVGCWALNRGPLSDSSIAISTTGVGEMLSKIQWASQCGSALQDTNFMTPVEAISKTIKDKFLESPFVQTRKEPKVVGMIGLVWEGHRGEFVWGHSSPSLIVAVGGSNYKKIKTVFSTSKAKLGVDSVKVEAISI